MLDPVTTNAGMTYERAKIMEWFRTHRSVASLPVLGFLTPASSQHMRRPLAATPVPHPICVSTQGVLTSESYPQRSIDPLTGLRLGSKRLVPNMVLKSLITSWRQHKLVAVSQSFEATSLLGAGRMGEVCGSR